MDYSYIVPSTPCACGGEPGNGCMVLRRPSRDICTECGIVRQEFGNFRFTISEDDTQLIPIPAEVADVAEKFLRTKLFSLLRHFIDSPRSFGADHDKQSRTQVHRAGGVGYIELRGKGNCAATLRWSYSETGLYRKQDKLKTFESSIARMPTRIRRAAEQVAGHLGFCGLHTDDRRYNYSLRFQKDIEIKQRLIGTANLCLVVAVDLHWLQVGTSFCSGNGPRVYEVGGETSPKYTLEECVDQALHRHMGGRASGAWNRQVNQQAHVSIKIDSVALHNHSGQERLTFLQSYGPGHFASPAPCVKPMLIGKSGYHLRISAYGDPVSSMTVSVDDNEVLSTKLVVHNACYRIPQASHPKEPWFEVPENASTVRVCFLHEGQERERYEYMVNTADEYMRRWEQHRSPILERAKRHALSELYRTGGFHYSKNPAPTFKKGEKVAVNIDGWVEAEYCSLSKDDDGHVVYFAEGHGRSQFWVVCQVKNLDEALMEGLDVGIYFRGNFREDNGAQLLEECKEITSYESTM